MAALVISSRNTIIKAWLIAGTLDIASALIYYSIKVGNNPLNVLVYVAKVALGKDISSKDIFANGAILAAIGLLVHYIIAFAWTVVFFRLYPKISLLNKNKIVAGIVYGIFVWVMMNLLIVPLRNMAMPHLVVQNAVINAVILVLAVGMPLSFIIGDYYLKLSSQE